MRILDFCPDNLGECVVSVIEMEKDKFFVLIAVLWLLVLLSFVCVGLIFFFLFWKAWKQRTETFVCDMLHLKIVSFV